MILVDVLHFWAAVAPFMRARVPHALVYAVQHDDLLAVYCQMWLGWVRSLYGICADALLLCVTRSRDEVTHS